MIRCLRTSLFPCVREEVDKLENYVLEFGVRGRKAWTGTEPWSWYRSYSLTETGEVSETVKARLLEIDTLRRRVAEPLQKLEQSLRAAENVRSQTQALYEFLVDLGVPEHLQEMKLLAEKE
jgi:ATP-dependent helicase/nuclease subunit B